MRSYAGKRASSGLSLALVIAVHVALAVGLLVGLSPVIFSEPIGVTQVVAVDDPQNPPEPIPETQLPKDIKTTTTVEVDLPKLPQESTSIDPEPSSAPTNDGEGGAGLAPGRPASKPDYPAASIRLGEEGKVKLLVHVRADGSVARVEVVSSSGYKRLDDAAVRWALAQKWRPAVRGGVAVDGVAEQWVTFKLTER